MKIGDRRGENRSERDPLLQGRVKVSEALFDESGDKRAKKSFASQYHSELRYHSDTYDNEALRRNHMYDSDMVNYSADEFEAPMNKRRFKGSLSKTGRQRRKQVARGQKPLATKSKRLLSWSCVASSVDAQELYDQLGTAQYEQWQRSIYGDEVVRLFKRGKDPGSATAADNLRDKKREDFDEEDIDPKDGIWWLGSQEVSFSLLSRIPSSLSMKNSKSKRTWLFSSFVFMIIASAN